MGKTTIAKTLKKEVTFIGKKGAYRFDFSPDIGDVNMHPEKYEQYLIKPEIIATTPDAPDPVEVKEDEYIEVNGVKYKRV